MANPDSFYTYIYYDPSRNNEPIYVGKGHGKRVWAHLNIRKKKHPFVQRLQFMKRNGISPIIGIYSGLTEEEAFSLEIWFIHKFGRKDLKLGTLLNRTDGGEGASGSKSQKGIKRSEEWKRKHKLNSDRRRGKPNGRKGLFTHSEETKKKLSMKLRGRKMSAGWLKKQKLRKASSSTLIKRSNAQIARWKKRRDNNIPDPVKSFNKIQGPDRIYKDVYEAAECNNVLISAIYRWCDPKTPVKSRPGWSIIKEKKDVGRES